MMSSRNRRNSINKCHQNENNQNNNRSSSNKSSNYHHSPSVQQQKFPVASTIFCAALIALIFGSSEHEVEGRIRRESLSHLPLSMDKEMFPPQDFDAEAPICLAEREPCGFYSFSLDGKAPLKWIKSWCRCSPKHECVYERTDMRMRVYRQTCVLKNEDEQPLTLVEEEEDEVKPKPMEEEEEEIAAASSQENQTTAPTSTPAHHRHHHHHHHHHHHGQHRRHVRRANRRRVIRRLRAITLVD